MTEFRLTSTPMINSAGMIVYLTAMFRHDTKNAVNILVQGYSLSKKTATGLLNGSIPHTIEGENVVFKAKHK